MDKKRLYDKPLNNIKVNLSYFFKNPAKYFNSPGNKRP